MKAGMPAQLVVDALMMVLWRRGKPRELLHHSDQGSQYTSDQFQGLLAEAGITCSKSKRGYVWDNNSAMESFFSSLKTGELSRTVYQTREPGADRHVRLHGALLQPQASALDHRHAQPGGLRGKSSSSASSGTFRVIGGSLLERCARKSRPYRPAVTNHTQRTTGGHSVRTRGRASIRYDL
jgi:transposase InsO family protein